MASLSKSVKRKELLLVEKVRLIDESARQSQRQLAMNFGIKKTQSTVYNGKTRFERLANAM